MYSDCHPHGARKAFWGGRALALVIVVLAILIVTTTGLLSAPAQAVESVDYDAEEIAFFNLLNDHRVENGLKPVYVSDKLSLAAQRHSSDMGTYRFFSHTTAKSSWFPSGYDPFQRMASVGYDYNTAKGENIAAGYKTGLSAFLAFKVSSGHNATMLKADYKVVGIGREYVKGSPYGWYGTVDFGGYTDHTTHGLGRYTPGMYDQTDRRISYVGWWGGAPNFWWTNKSGAGTVVAFKGTAVYLLAPKGPGFGKAEVKIDGGSPVTVDFSATSYGSRQLVFKKEGLSDGSHTLTMKCITPGRAMALDAVRVMKTSTVGGELLTAPKPQTYQDHNFKLAYSGNWTPVDTRSASGWTFRSADEEGAKVTIKFKGVNLTWLARTTRWYGKAEVTVDGDTENRKVVNLFSWWTRWQVPVYDTGLLDYGEHTVEIRWAGRKNDWSWGTSISVDAFKIRGELLR